LYAKTAISDSLIVGLPGVGNQGYSKSSLLVLS